jgi:hypothetical protein
MTTKIDTSHVSKFNGSYFNIWKHRLMLIQGWKVMVVSKMSNELHLQQQK